jgi:CheY-like chemotaxis protein
MNDSKRVLVADDQADVLEALKMLLKGEDRRPCCPLSRRATSMLC